MGDTTTGKSREKENEYRSSSGRSSSVTESDKNIRFYRDDDENLTCSEQWDKYPKHVFFIVGMEFCERFSYYGMRSVLLLYLRNYLHFSDDLATAVYHAFTVLAYFTPVIGAIIADSYWGKYKTIWLLSIVYIFGHVVKTIGSIPYVPSATAHVVLSMLGLFFIACGTGGIKPCVSSFGGDQFKPEQTYFRKQFFSLFYFAINAGSLISTFVTPILRADVDCYPNETGEEFEECYALAFGIPAALMLIALVLFLAGTRWYTRFPPEGSVFWKFCHCIGSGIKHWWKTPRAERTKEHWLDNAKSSPKMIRETKYVLRILVLFIPLPFFWALFDQQGSRWTLQAIELDGNLGSLHLLPDQIETLNPIFIVTLIPLFEATLYPCLRHFRIPFTPLRRMTLGLFLAGISFVLAGILQIQIEAQRTPLPGRGDYAVRVINSAKCDLQFTADDPGLGTFTVAQNNVSDTKGIFLKVKDTLNLKYEGCSGDDTKTVSVTPKAEHILEVLVRGDDEEATKGEMIIEKSEDGGGSFSFVNAYTEKNVTLEIDGEDPEKVVVMPGQRSKVILVATGNITFYITVDGENKTGWIDVEVGAVYSVIIQEKLTYWKVRDINPNSINVGWIFPQFFIITLGEVFLSVTGLEFSYSQAPPSMKSVVSSLWLLTVSFGNIIVLIIAGVQTIESQVAEFFLFAGLIFVAGIVFIILAYFYVPVDENEFEEELRNTFMTSGGGDKEKGGQENYAFSPEETKRGTYASDDDSDNDYVTVL